MSWHRADVAAASAALLFNLLPDLLELPAAEQYRRLVAHIDASLTAYDDAREEFGVPEPSEN